MKQDKELCHLLYDAGANVNEPDIEGNSICHIISCVGDKEWLEYLVTKFNLNCFLKNNKGNTALLQAILAGRESVVEYYLTFTPNINWKNKVSELNEYYSWGKHVFMLLSSVKTLEYLS
jgi:ankyrin repeat protein